METWLTVALVVVSLLSAALAWVFAWCARTDARQTHTMLMSFHSESQAYYSHTREMARAEAEVLSRRMERAVEKRQVPPKPEVPLTFDMPRTGGV